MLALGVCVLGVFIQCIVLTHIIYCHFVWESTCLFTLQVITHFLSGFDLIKGRFWFYWLRVLVSLSAGVQFLYFDIICWMWLLHILLICGELLSLSSKVSRVYGLLFQCWPGWPTWALQFWAVILAVLGPYIVGKLYIRVKTELSLEISLTLIQCKWYFHLD